MADTVGDLIEKLSTATLRLWHLEARCRELDMQLQHGRARQAAELRSLAGELANLARMVSQVNLERNSLIDQINGALAVLIAQARSQHSTFQLTANELLGTGQNKFSQTEQPRPEERSPAA
jgi:hypothetical protein